jgi:hypothetical protein
VRYIELRLHDIQQLFNSLDPSPFREKDIDRDAEEFIVGWSNEIPLKEPLGLRVHLEQPPRDDPAPLIRDAVRHYFASRAAHATLEFRQLMRQGRLTLVIGLVFLGACITAAEVVARGGTVWAEYVRESLTIAGWVAMWRPMHIYLYEWWPVRRQITNLTRLSTMRVEVIVPTQGNRT